MHWITEQFAGRHVGLLLWAGVGVLSVAVLILSRTRWGQARPLAKCIGLSVYAHLLLGGYAYMTNYFEPPLPPEPEEFRVAFIEHDALLAEEPYREEDNDQLPDPQPSEASPVAARPLDEPPEAEPESPEPPVQQSLPQEAPAPEASEEPESEENETPAEQIVESDSPAEIEPQELEPAQETPPPEVAPVQQMADVPTASEEEAEAITDPLEQLQAMALAEVASSEADVQQQDPISRASPSEMLASVAPALPRRSGDGAVMPAPYRNRVEPLKSEALRRHGGDQRTEASVNAALRWLANNQAADGRYSAAQHGAGQEARALGHDRGGAGSRADTAMTGLAVLAFVGAGHSHLEGDYQDTVRRALEFLLRQQKANGDLAGDSLLYARMYCHGIAFLALSETYAMSGDPRLKPFVEVAMHYTVTAQHKTTGGWRYQPGEQGDLSQFGWQVMALRSAEHAGLEIPAVTRTRIETFLRSVTAGTHGGLARYRKGDRITRTMTAEALACRHFLGLNANRAAINEATGYVLAEPPAAGKPNLYYWYYATVGLFPQQDEAWRNWNAALVEQLIARQRTDGAYGGSWDTDTVWGAHGGRVYTTALSALCLEVYYRYQPLYQAEDTLQDIRAAGRPLPWRR